MDQEIGKGKRKNGWKKKKKSCLISKAIFSDILGDGRMVMLVHITKISDGLIPEKSGQGRAQALKVWARVCGVCVGGVWGGVYGGGPGGGVGGQPPLGGPGPWGA